MRTLVTISILFCTVLLSAQAGTESKEELKEWKNMAKEFKKEPLLLRDKITGYEQAIDELSNKIAVLEAENKSLEESNRSLHSQVSTLEGEVQKLEQDLAEIDYVEKPSPANPMAEQLLFFVQIGAYEFFNINHYFEGVKCMNVQLNEGLNKYVVGSFSDVNKAHSFRDDVVKLGIDDAWVVSMLNGERIPMQDALQLLQEMGTFSDEQIEQLRALYAEQIEIEQNLTGPQTPALPMQLPE